MSVWPNPWDIVIADLEKQREAVEEAIRAVREARALADPRVCTVDIRHAPILTVALELLKKPDARPS